jgi:predicted protein tyrosine phosphatase
MKRLLFVCSQNRLRSPTAARVFAEWPGVETASAGLSPEAATPVTSALIDWADDVLVMEERHKNELARRFGAHLKGKKLAVLDIPDVYLYMQPELVRLLEAKVPRCAGL